MKVQKIKNTRFSTCLVLLMSCFLLSYAEAAPQVTKINDTVVDSQALNGFITPFQQDAVVTHNGWQYVTYYSANRYVCVARRQLPSGTWQSLELTDYYFSSTDGHNVISMGICPNDGTIHLSFDHHGSTLHYRVSVPGVATNPETITWNSSLFGPVRQYLEVGKSVSGVTYPGFWQTPAGNLQMYYRIGGSGDGDSVLVDYDGTSGVWKNTRKVISRSGTYSDLCGAGETSRNAYLNGPCYGPNGTLHLTWCWRESASGTNHDILHAYSNDEGFTWYNTERPQQSTQIATGSGQAVQTLVNLSWTSTGPKIVGRSTGDPATEQLISVLSEGITAVPITRYYGLINQQAQAVDPQGRIHTVMWHCTDESYAYVQSLGYSNYGCDLWGPVIARHYHHYWRDSTGTWHHNELPGFAGTRPKLFIRANGDAFLIYQSHPNPASLGSALNFSDGDLTIQAATAASQWTDWQVVHLETGPFNNEMIGDPYRFKQEEILSVLVRNKPLAGSPTSPLRILDFQLQ